MPNSHVPAIDGYSPVSYFEAGKPELGRAEFHANHDGKHYLFTSAAQVATFQKNPGKYAPSFGGTCAFGHSIEKEFPVDPTSFKIVDDHLLLFLKNADVDAKALWEKEGDAACMVKANKHYSQAKHG
jgi:YHS domain-containing protein